MLNRSLNSLIYALLLFAGLAYVASTAHAGEVASCSVGGGTLAFGNYQPSTGNRTTAGSVQTKSNKDKREESGQTKKEFREEKREKKEERRGSTAYTK